MRRVVKHKDTWWWLGVFCCCWCEWHRFYAMTMKNICFTLYLTYIILRQSIQSRNSERVKLTWLDSFGDAINLKSWHLDYFIINSVFFSFVGVAVIPCTEKVQWSLRFNDDDTSIRIQCHSLFVYHEVFFS